MRDGNHRISVARALGDVAIDARVIEYDLAPRGNGATMQTTVAARA